MKAACWPILGLAFLSAAGLANGAPDLVALSRESAVMVFSAQGQSAGTGFFISERYVATCFHVIARTVGTEEAKYFALGKFKVNIRHRRQIAIVT